MGFFSAFKYASIYESRLKALGMNPRDIPPDLNAAICSEAERMATSAADRFRMSGSERTDHIGGTMRNAASVVACLCLGPEIAAKQLYREVIDSLAADWVHLGEQGSFDLQLLHRLNECGVLNRQAAYDFMAARDRRSEDR